MIDQRKYFAKQVSLSQIPLKKNLSSLHFLLGETGSRNLQFKPLTSSSISLTWSLISSDTPCGGKRALYKVQWKKTNQMAINVKYIDGFNCTITGLDQQIEYEFRISSCATKNDKSLWMAFKLPDSIEGSITDVNNTALVLQKPPEFLDLSFLNRTSVNLTWFGDVGNVVYAVCFIEASKGCDANMLCNDDRRLRR